MITAREVVPNTISNDNGTTSHMYPFYFQQGEGEDKQVAGVERIDGTDYFFGDIDVALAAFKSYLEGLPRRP